MRRFKQLSIFIILTFFFYCVSIAQQKKIVFNNFSVKEGLSSNIVNTIVQDNDGFIWIATSDGLCRFDGTTIKNYNSIQKDSTSLIAPAVRFIHVDKYGALWIMTSAGLSKFNKETDNFKNFYYKPGKQPLPEKDIDGYLVDRNGNLWILQKNSESKYLVDVQKEKVTLIIKPFEFAKKKASKTDWLFRMVDNENNLYITHSLSKEIIKINYTTKIIKTESLEFNFFKDHTIKSNPHYFFVDSKENFYVSNNGLFCKYKGTNNFVSIDLFNGRMPKDETDFMINTMTEDAFGNIWIGTRFYGVIIYNIKTRQFDKLAEKTNFPAKDVTINKDHFGDMWFTSGPKDILSYHNKTKQFLHFFHKQYDIMGIPQFDYGQVYADNSQTYWLCTRNYGISFFNLEKAKFRLFQHQEDNPNSINSNNIWGMCEDSQGRLLMSGNGLNIYDFKTGLFDKFLEKDNPEYAFFNGIPSIIEIKPNEYLIGTYMVGWYRYENHKIIKIRDLRPDPNNKNSLCAWGIICMYKDKNNEIWIGTHGGVSHYRMPNKENPEGVYINYYHDDADKTTIPSSEVWGFLHDSKNRIWICTNIAFGYLSPDRKIFHTVSPVLNGTDTLHRSDPKFIIEDQKELGVYWITTEKNGLIKYTEKENRFEQFSTKDGFPTNLLYGVIQDNSGFLWISSSKGLIKFDPKTKKIEVFTESDGLQDRQFVAGSFHKGEYTGNFYFGGNSGLNAFNPDEIKLSNFVPNIRFSALRIFNKEIHVNEHLNERIVLTKEINYIDELVLTHKENIFSISFAALHFSAPKRIKYLYMLEGFEKNWNEVSYNQNFAGYTNLDQGIYTLRVKSTNCDGVWVENERSLKIKILPPWWLTWWFKISVILSIAISIVSYYKYKTYEIRKQNEKLEQKVAKRTAEVMQQKEEIQQQAEELEATNEELIAQSDALREANEDISRSKEEIEKALKSSKLLSEFGQKITSVLDLEKINESIYTYVVSLIKVDAFGIGIYDEANNVLEYNNFMENGIAIPKFTKNLSVPNSLSAYCFNNNKSLIINNLANEYKNYINEMPNISTKETPKSLIHIPLVTSNKKLGIFAVNSYETDSYSQNDFTNLLSLASYISIALDNAYTYQKIQQQNNQLVELDKFKESMTGMIVHDLKNPLNAIMGLSSMESENDIMLMINAAGYQMLNLVMNILDVQKFEDTSMKLSLQNENLNDLVNNAMKQVSLLVKQKNILLTNELENNYVVSADGELIVRVIVNLLTNAIKFTPNSGKIAIGNEENDSSQNTNEQFLTICVKDTGQGIPQDKLHLVFEKFGQVVAKKSGGVRSTGLGLTFCKLSVEAHGGKIWVESEVNVGTTFKFTLPLVERSQSEVHDIISAQTDLNLSDISHNLTIYFTGKQEFTIPDNKAEYLQLIKDSKFNIVFSVDDEILVHQTMLEFLKKSNEELWLICCSSSKIAEESIVYFKPDVILLDWNMPDLSGIELLKVIKSNNQIKKTPVAIITSRFSEQDLEEAFDSGATEYLKKPFDKDDLISRIKTLLRISKILLA